MGLQSWKWLNNWAHIHMFPHIHFVIINGHWILPTSLSAFIKMIIWLGYLNSLSRLQLFWYGINLLKHTIFVCSILRLVQIQTFQLPTYLKLLRMLIIYRILSMFPSLSKELNKASQECEYPLLLLLLFILNKTYILQP